jgi:predicted HicB family RNase H-like nuclease
MAALEREQTTIRLPAELLEALRREANERGYSLNGYIIRLIELGRKSESSRLSPRIQK